jgi:hypothetical protein
MWRFLNFLKLSHWVDDGGGDDDDDDDDDGDDDKVIHI